MYPTLTFIHQGNYAGTLAYTYLCVAVVFWPRHPSVAVRRAQGPESLCSAVSKLVERGPGSPTALGLLRVTVKDCLASRDVPGARRCLTILQLLRLIATVARELRRRATESVALESGEGAILGGRCTDVEERVVGDGCKIEAKPEHAGGGVVAVAVVVPAGSKRLRDGAIAVASASSQGSGMSSADAQSEVIPLPMSTCSALRKLAESAVELLGLVFGSPSWRSSLPSLEPVAEVAEAYSGGGANVLGGGAIADAIKAVVQRGGITLRPVRDLCMSERLRPMRVRLVRALVGSLPPLTVKREAEVNTAWRCNVDAVGVSEFVWGAAREVLSRGDAGSAVDEPLSPSASPADSSVAPLAWTSVAQAVRDRLLPLISSVSSGADPLLSVETSPSLSTAAVAGEEHACALIAGCRLARQRLKRAATAEALRYTQHVASLEHRAARERLSWRDSALAFAQSQVDKAARSLPQPGLSQFCQPAATLPGHSLVESFLRGPERAKSFRLELPGIGHAREFANRYFGGRDGQGTYMHSSLYSADAVASGVGSNACITITKRDARLMFVAAHKSAVQALEVAQKERDDVKTQADAALRKLEAAEAALKDFESA